MQLLLSGLIHIDETLHICGIRPEDCMKKDNPGLINIKGDNSREIIICVGCEEILCDLTHCSS